MSPGSPGDINGMLRLRSVYVSLCLGLWAVAAGAAPEGRVRVIDGDTFEVGQGAGAVTVRLQGVDAPEGAQRCAGADGRAYDCGARVTSTVRDRYEGRRARCETVEQDAYGRSVAFCEVAGEDVGRWLVAEGLAVAYRRYSMRYDLEEKQAFAAQRGLWAGEFLRPERWRAAERERQAAANAPDPGSCRIKGNISGSGQIYHLPGQEHYGVTKISPGRGERWFCSEAEAQAAGWRRAKR